VDRNELIDSLGRIFNDESDEYVNLMIERVRDSGNDAATDVLDIILQKQEVIVPIVSPSKDDDIEQPDSGGAQSDISSSLSSLLGSLAVNSVKKE